ncbi:MAG: efflux transporter outer membrane subunit [Burkholderiales bacterium]|nr:efflux transporter outer membrane subunit [Burkholderiales bacterium]
MTCRRRPCATGGLALALMLAGCTTMIPGYERPAAPIAQNYPGATAAQAPGGAAASQIEWQSYFGDARLKRLIEVALNNNRDLRVAVLNIEQARAQYQLRRSDELPTLGIGAAGSRQPGPGGSIVSTYSAGLVVPAYELDFFGRVRSLSAAALAQYLGTEEARKNVQIALISSVASSYLNMLADDGLLAVTRSTLLTREESLKLTRLKFDAGAASELDYRQAESLFEGARAALALLTRQRAVDENALVLLLGQSMPADLPPGQSIAGQTLINELPVGLPSEVLVRRPDVRQAEQQLIAANANIGAARAAFFPQITLTGSAGSASSELSGLFKSGSFAWSFAPQLLLPIFDAGRNQANLELANVNREIAVAQYEKAIQTAFREVSDALAGRATLGVQVRAQAAQVNAEAVRFKLADLRYRNGVANYLDVLDAQRALFVTQLALVQVQAQEVQNQVALYKVLGGGWKTP